MLNVEDILSEQDVLTKDSTVLDAFGPNPAAVSALLQDKRTIAVQSWLALALEKTGYSPVRHSARRAPDRALGFTGSVFTDLTGLVSDKALDAVDLSTVLVTPGTDALYVAFAEPFRSTWVTMLDAFNANTLTAAFTYWNGGWATFNSLVDGTRHSAAKSFSGSGRIGWQQPTDWEKRPLNGEGTWRFWMRIKADQTPSAGTNLTQILPVRNSRFTDPAAFYALSMLYTESWGAQRGDWQTKAAAFGKMAGDALADTLALMQISDEFLMEDAESVHQTDASSTAPEQSSDLFTWQRG